MREKRSEGAKTGHGCTAGKKDLSELPGAEGGSERGITAQRGCSKGPRLLGKGRRSLLSHLGPWMGAYGLGNHAQGANGTQLATAASLAPAAVALETSPNTTGIRHVPTRHALILSPLILFKA